MVDHSFQNADKNFIRIENIQIGFQKYSGVPMFDLKSSGQIQTNYGKIKLEENEQIIGCSPSPNFKNVSPEFRPKAMQSRISETRSKID